MYSSFNLRKDEYEYFYTHIYLIIFKNKTQDGRENKHPTKSSYIQEEGKGVKATEMEAKPLS